MEDLIFSGVFVACFLIYWLVQDMIADKNRMIRFFGYLIAICTAIGMLWFVLYHYFDRNLLKLFE